MSVDFTVAICTYNGADRLPKVFDALRDARNDRELFWEILAVDNNSTDNTAEVIQNHARDWRSDSRIRYLFEPRQGTTHARHRALQEATSDLVGLLDDDNLPTSPTGWSKPTNSAKSIPKPEPMAARFAPD